MSAPVDVQAERLRERREQLYAVIREHGDPCIVCENSIKDFADEALALLAGQAEQIERLTKERDEAQRFLQELAMDHYFARAETAERQRDTLRDALQRIADEATDDAGWMRATAKRALGAAAVGEDTE